MRMLSVYVEPVSGSHVSVLNSIECQFSNQGSKSYWIAIWHLFASRPRIRFFITNLIGKNHNCQISYFGIWPITTAPDQKAKGESPCLPWCIKNRGCKMLHTFGETITYSQLEMIKSVRNVIATMIRDCVHHSRKSKGLLWMFLSVTFGDNLYCWFARVGASFNKHASQLATSAQESPRLEEEASGRVSLLLKAAFANRERRSSMSPEQDWKWHWT